MQNVGLDLNTQQVLEIAAHDVVQTREVVAVWSRIRAEWQVGNEPRDNRLAIPTDLDVAFERFAPPHPPAPPAAFDRLDRLHRLRWRYGAQFVQPSVDRVGHGIVPIARIPQGMIGYEHRAKAMRGGIVPGEC